MSKLYKLSSAEENTKKKFVSACSLDELKSKGAISFGLNDTNCEISTSDGFTIDSEDVFQLISSSEPLVLKAVNVTLQEQAIGHLNENISSITQADEPTQPVEQVCSEEQIVTAIEPATSATEDEIVKQVL